MRSALICALVLAAGCGPALQLDPSKGSMSGQFEVTGTAGELSSMTDPLTVQIGNARAYNVSHTGRQVQFTVQGVDTPGEATVTVTDRHGLQLIGSMTFTGPLDPHFARMTAMGASLTMGMQTASLSIHSQTHGAAFQIARAAGAYLSMPLVKDGYLPSITFDDFNKQTCALDGGILNLLQARAGATIQKVSDSNGGIHVEWIRVDPKLDARDVAIGGERIAQDVDGGGGLFPVTMEHLVWDPYVSNANDLFSDPPDRMLDRVAEMSPTMVISTDLFINDLDNVDLGTSGIPDLSALTPMTTFQASLDTILNRLDATGADLFFADAPDITLLQSYQDKVQSLLAAGYTQAQATGWLQGIQARTQEMNAALAAEVAKHPHLHIVPMNAKVAEIFQSGADVGGTHLTTRPFDGLLSLDNLHFSDTGYAILAQLFVDTINQTYGSNLPAIDLSAVLASDPYSVANLQAAGFTCAGQ